MSVQILKESDGSLAPLQGKTVAILGFGSQGHAHAQNGRDSGINIIVSELEGTDNYKAAVEAGFTPIPADEAVKQADIILVTLPDEVQPTVYDKQIGPNLKAGQTFVATHGFNIHFKTIVPPKDVNIIMVAPKGPGHVVRSEFERGGGVPCLIAVHQDATGNALELGKSYGMAIGCARAGLLQTTFKEETETDLFGEQAVLCGGASQLVLQGFKTLTDAGYQPEVAYFECLHELKLIVDMMVEGGVSWMRHSISETAEWGDYKSGPRVVNESSKKAMEDILAEIQDGTFVKGMIAEWDNGAPEYNRFKAEGQAEPIEKVGKELRSMMSWISNPDVPA